MQILIILLVSLLCSACATSGSQQNNQLDATELAASAKGVREAIGEQRPALRACYEDALEVDPAFMGRMVARFTVVSDGSVESVAVADSTFENEAMTDCLLTSMRQWTFPKLDGDKTESLIINYPFEFTPESPGSESD